MYKYIAKVWKKPKQNLDELWKQRLVKWRKEPATIRIEYPTRLDRARSLGYKAKPGFIILRQRVLAGGRQRPDIKGARRSKHNRQRKNLNMSYQWIAEQRAQKKFINCEVLNSYWVAKDGKFYWFEIIMVDRASPVIMKDKNINWICSQKGRVFKGLTSAGKKSRGLLNKGRGAEKIRPSLRAHDNRAH